MMGRPAKPPVMVPRFGFGGFMNVKHMALSLIFMIIIFAIFVLYISLRILPEMEELNEELQELIESGASDVETQGPPITEIRIAYFASLILFGLLDGIFVVMLWRAKAPLRNETILSPLYSVYTATRVGAIILISQISIGVIVGDNPGELITLLYFMVFVSTVISIAIIMVVHKKVLGQIKGDDVVFKLPEDTGT